MTMWISVMQAAERLRVTHQTVRNWLATGKLRGTKLPPLGIQVVDAASLRDARAKRWARARR